MGVDHTPSATASSRPQGLDFARRIYAPRSIGVVLCGLCILGTVFEREGHLLYWIGGFYTVFVWPTLAYLHASRSAHPLKAELLNLWVDGLYVGFWLAVIEFSLIPSTALVMAVTLSFITVGGFRFLGLGLTGILAGLVAGILVWGFQWTPESSSMAQLAALPLLLGYPLLMGKTLFNLTMKLKRSRRELRYLSEHDFLSGVRNRRYFDETLQTAFRQYQRSPRSLTLVIGDVDGFKQINDGHGHAAGDEVIRHVAAALTTVAREGDVVARLGGDEFVVLMADADLDAAVLYTRRVQQVLNQRLAARPDAMAVHMSFGMAAAHEQLADHEAWLEQADKALYENKRQRVDAERPLQPAAA